jgi:predicted ThiF/HesA family dinucleotide-utilizing enzyme
MAYLSKGSDAQAVELKVQELIVKLSDTAIVTSSASNVTIDAQQTIKSVVNAIHVKDGSASPLTVSVANQTVSGSTVTLALTAAFAANDSIRLCFTV